MMRAFARRAAAAAAGGRALHAGRAAAVATPLLRASLGAGPVARTVLPVLGARAPLALFSTAADDSEARRNDYVLSNAELMCKYAAAGDLEALQRVLAQGVDINAADYDKRTALHLAASEGNVAVIEFLLDNGASVHVTDRWGNTPLSDAARCRNQSAIALLRSNGAQLSFSDHYAAAICQAAASGDASEISYLLDVGVPVNQGDYDSRTPLHLAAAEGQLPVVQMLLERGADPGLLDRFGNTALLDAERHGHEDVAHYLQSFGASKEGHTVASPVRPSTARIAELQEHMNKVMGKLIDQGIYNSSLIYEELDWYYNKLQLQPYYFKRFDPEQVAFHVKSYIASKNASANNPDDIQLKMERTGSAFYLCPDDYGAMIEIERAIEAITDRWDKEHPGKCQSLIHFLSEGTAVPYGSKQLALYIVDTQDYVQSNPSPGETNLNLISSKQFLATATPPIRNRYQIIMDEVVGRNSPLVKIMDPYRKDGTIPLMIAFRINSVSTSMHRITELLRSKNVTWRRKMAQTFSNGVNVYTVYLNPSAEDHAKEIAEHLSLLFSVPQSRITPMYLDQTLSAPEYAYASAVMKFAFWFYNQDNEDLKGLGQALSGDSINLNRLDSLRNQLRTESISQSRIAECFMRYPDLVRDCYQDFSEITDPDNARKPAFREDISVKITRAAVDEVDQKILHEFLHFNANLLKTNFRKTPKASFAFRLDPKFLVSDTYPRVPFGIFMVMANDFIGFHVRFNDVARGGIRIIRSGNTAAYARNFTGLFHENYNLAYTQNMKNKDIPEFGSKGTILLGPTSQNNAEYAFRKYISGLVDLQLPSEEIVDHYEKDEILFLGPDEGTADLMAWAAHYAKRRGFPYWKSFTTGKPQEMGGIPHDVYGMTTRSVHTYVLKALEKLGLDETQITKVQTGGPDGDLGSNEVLISKDKTIAIVDGSGVLYDPEGLDRDGLLRLVNNKQMVSKFNGELSDQGFLVRIEDRDIVLPSGEKVESGLNFRNEFHLHPLSSATLFVPCGGRPESINGKNVHRMFHPDGTPRFSIIVEGANLFLTQDARNVLEQAGVVLFKDASTNKGGVTSSSLEVLAGLALTESEFAKHMSIKDGVIPEFYKTYVKEVQRRVCENAELEFECIWREHQSSEVPSHILTDHVSDKINFLNERIDKSALYEDKKIRHNVLSRAIPSMLIDLVGGIEVMEERLPPAYAKAIFNAYLASRYVYEHGIHADEFAFYTFIGRFDDGN